MKVLAHGVLVLLLSALTQVGGVAWLLSRITPRPLATFLPIYLACSLAVIPLAAMGGRTPVSCLSSGPLIVASPLYCALNRTYVAPEMHAALTDLAGTMATRFPGTQTQMLDGNFPLFDGFPLLPHLSHADGEKADVAFYYRTPDGAPVSQLRSPLGYFAFEQGPTDCQPATLSLRWDLAWLQPLMRDLPVDSARMRAALDILSADARISKVFVEPHLRTSFGATHPKVRFQGCRAARHDDHLHIQL